MAEHSSHSQDVYGDVLQAIRAGSRPAREELPFVHADGSQCGAALVAYNALWNLGVVFDTTVDSVKALTHQGTDSGTGRQIAEPHTVFVVKRNDGKHQIATTLGATIRGVPR